MCARVRVVRARPLLGRTRASPSHPPLPSQFAWGIVRVFAVEASVKQPKFFFFSWNGTTAPLKRKVYANGMKTQVLNYFDGLHGHAQISAHSDLTEEAVVARLNASRGSHKPARYEFGTGDASSLEDDEMEAKRIADEAERVRLEAQLAAEEAERARIAAEEAAAAAEEQRIREGAWGAVGVTCRRWVHYAAAAGGRSLAFASGVCVCFCKCLLSLLSLTSPIAPPARRGCRRGSGCRGQGARARSQGGRTAHAPQDGHEAARVQP